MSDTLFSIELPARGGHPRAVFYVIAADATTARVAGLRVVEWIDPFTLEADTTGWKITPVVTPAPAPPVPDDVPAVHMNLVTAVSYRYGEYGEEQYRVYVVPVDAYRPDMTEAQADAAAVRPGEWADAPGARGAQPDGLSYGYSCELCSTVGPAPDSPDSPPDKACPASRSGAHSWIADGR